MQMEGSSRAEIYKTKIKNWIWLRKDYTSILAKTELWL